jgi:putative glutamine amidotransferase
MSTPATDPPLIGITTDVVEASGGRLKSDCGLAYADCVARAGGIPLLLPAIPGTAGMHARVCDAYVLTGGDDPRTEPFGVPTHPEAKVMHARRQEYETALLAALADRPATPVLGVCLGMQLMSLAAGGSLNQHLPDTLPSAADHRGTHRIVPQPVAGRGVIRIVAGEALSSHHQAVAHPGRLAVFARSHDDVIEGVLDPDRPFYIGVQWHPERTSDPALGQSLFEQLVDAARRAKGGDPAAHCTRLGAVEYGAAR